MADSDELSTRLANLHGQVDELIAGEAAERLRGTLVPDRWNVLDVIAHINSWGWIFLGDARYMARHPGRPLPYSLYTASRYDNENEALVLRRRGWPVEQYATENRELSAALQAFVASFGGAIPDHPATQPWQPEPLNIAEVLAYHARHGGEHLQDVREALEKDRSFPNPLPMREK